MKTMIYKYDAPMNGEVCEYLNLVSVLTIMSQDGWPRIWAETLVSECEADNEMLQDWPRIQIMALGTGWEAPDEDEWKYFNSVIDGRGFVWHYYISVDENGEMLQEK